MDGTIYIEAQHLRKYGVETQAPVIALKLGEIGYWPIFTRASVLDLNNGELSEDLIDSAIAGSMWGWDERNSLATKAREYLEERLREHV
jgi:hypothetical protein